MYPHGTLAATYWNKPCVGSFQIEVLRVDVLKWLLKTPLVSKSGFKHHSLEDAGTLELYGIVLKDSIGFCMISTYLQVCIMQICHGFVLYAEMSLVT